MRSNGINRGKNPVFGIWSASSLTMHFGTAKWLLHSIALKSIYGVRSCSWRYM